MIISSSAKRTFACSDDNYEDIAWNESRVWFEIIYRIEMTVNGHDWRGRNLFFQSEPIMVYIKVKD